MADRYIIQPLQYGSAVNRPEGATGSGSHVLFPARDVRNGLSVTDDRERHLREKILAVLFTAPGERVNRPQFGVGLNRHLFEGLDELMLSALEFRVSEALHRDLGDEMALDGLDIQATPEEGELRLHIRYHLREDRVPRNLEIEL